MNRESTPIPEPVAELQRQLEQFRSAQPGRTGADEVLGYPLTKRFRELLGEVG